MALLSTVRMTAVVAAGCAAILGIGLVGATPDGESANRPTARAVSAADCASEQDGAAGQLKFSTTALSISESGAERVLLVLRTGGSSGPVSATVRTSDQSATAGSDYTSVDTTVEFPDGDATVRLIRVPIVGDSVHEDLETLAVSLSDPVCATLGVNASAVVSINDDDAVSTFAIGGTVSGLQGTGLVLRTNTFEEVSPGKGDFVFPRGLTAGSSYEVSVRTQPGNPGQICTVANGAGVMPESAVTDVAVSCKPPVFNEHLDPTFGAGGITTTPGVRGAQAVAVQPDGMIVTAGDDSLARYQPDGTPDTSFGTNGSVATGLDAASDGRAIDVALQPDGGIVVVGVIDNRSSTRGDFAVQRYHPNGVLDEGFGTAGTVMTDFSGGFDTAYAVAVRADGAILVAGSASSAGARSDFALARYTAAGRLDETYDGDGR
jgi:uncharacterized delta-60 repeat protein